MNTTKKVSISHVSNQHNSWLRSLTFYKTEMSILRGMLTEIAGKYTGADVAKEVEHYENQFRVQNMNIDALSHDIHANISAIAKQAQEASAGYIDLLLVTEHEALREKFNTQEQILTDLVRAFRAFAEKWM